MKCYECGKDAVVLVDDSVYMRYRVIANAHDKVKFKRAMCKECFQKFTGHVQEG